MAKASGVRKGASLLGKMRKVRVAHPTWSALEFTFVRLSLPLTRVPPLASFEVAYPPVPSPMATPPAVTNMNLIVHDNPTY